MDQLTGNRLCPQCRESDLVPTGAFLRCGACGYAITAQALARESADASTEVWSGEQSGKLRETG